MKGKDENSEENQLVNQMIKKIVDRLEAQNIRVKVDDRTNLRPGAKYFEWERKGVPLRMELGPRDAAKEEVLCAIRTGGEKVAIKIDDNFESEINSTLNKIHDTMLSKAEKRLEERTFRVDTYEEMRTRILSEDNAQLGFFLVPWKDDAENEEFIKTDCKATIRCYPVNINQRDKDITNEEDEFTTKNIDGLKCFYSGEPATHMAIFARNF